MVIFQEVFDAFKEKKCRLLMSEEEFNEIKRKSKEKYKYISSCGHEHEVYFHVFKHRDTGVICPTCIYKQDSINQKEKSKIERRI